MQIVNIFNYKLGSKNNTGLIEKRKTQIVRMLCRNLKTH